jgi:hypothetical protein
VRQDEQEDYKNVEERQHPAPYFTARRRAGETGCGPAALLLHWPAMKYLVLLALLTAFILLATVVLIVVYYWGPRGGPPKSRG